VRHTTCIASDPAICVRDRIPHPVAPSRDYGSIAYCHRPPCIRHQLTSLRSLPDPAAVRQRGRTSAIPPSVQYGQHRCMHGHMSA